uniref:Major facilitator superfamily (MFS) profile domain-containing protein n=1 Tax=Plectus sambesii TaxID=2011161 RepID=A0A914VNP2_9BILA
MKALLNNSNTMSWIAYAPVSNFADGFYGAGMANWFSLVYLICTVPVGIVAMWAGQKFGLRTAILIAAWTNGIGGLIRFGSSFLGDGLRFPVAIFGQAIASVAYPFIMFLPTKVAGTWFPDKQRAIATTIGVMSNPLGVLFANLISPALVRSANHILYLNALTFILCTIACLIATVGVTRSEPKKPPTHSASQAQMPFVEGLKKCFKSKAYMVLFLVMGGGIGMFNCLYTIMQQLLCPKGYDNVFSGICCSLMIVGGVFGATGAGIFVGRTKMYEETMKVAMALAVIAGVVFTQLALHPHLQVWIAITCFMFGVLGLATYPVGLELSAECTFPVSETTSTGLIVLSGQVQGFIFVVLMSLLGKPLTQDAHLQKCTAEDTKDVVPKDMTLAVLVFSGVAVLLVLILIITFKPKYRRLNMEKNAGNKQAAGAKGKDDQGGVELSTISRSAPKTV